MDNEWRVKEIADYYGFEPQSNQLVEEMVELIQALNKYRRACGKGQITTRTQPVAFKNVVEEIADVEIMLEQIKYILGVDPNVLEDIKTLKLERTLTRIHSAEEGYYG